MGRKGKGKKRRAHFDLKREKEKKSKQPVAITTREEKNRSKRTSYEAEGGERERKGERKERKGEKNYDAYAVLSLRKRDDVEKKNRMER